MKVEWQEARVKKLRKGKDGGRSGCTPRGRCRPAVSKVRRRAGQSKVYLVLGHGVRGLQRTGSEHGLAMKGIWSVGFCIEYVRSLPAPFSCVLCIFWFVGFIY